MNLKRHFRKKVVSAFALLMTIGAGDALAQVTTNEGSGLAPSYPDLATAVTALNAATITSPVVITLGANETAPLGGYSITAQGSSSNTIVIDGGNHTVTAAGSQTAGSLSDALIKLVGADYVTIQNFSLTENAANTVTTAASNNMTEWGVALLYASTTNGAQNCTIKGCTIDLDRTYPNTFGIYSNSTHAATTPTTSASATTSTGGNSGLVIWSNNITDVNNGIVVVGPTAAADLNEGLDIGGTSAATANTITNFGTNGTFSGYANVATAGVNGILVRNVRNFNVSYNTVTSSAGGTTSGTVRGIHIPAFSAAPATAVTNSINNNVVSLRSAVASGTILGINVEASATSTTSALNINNNDFNTFGHTVTASGTITFISNVAVSLTTNINGNTFTNMSVNTTGSLNFISNSWTRPANAVSNANNNAIVGTFAKTGGGGTVLFYNSFSTTAASTNAIETTNNNNFSNMTFTGATTITGWRSGDGSTSAPFGPKKIANNNTFSNIVCGTSGAVMLEVDYSNSGVTTNDVSGNVFSNITGGGAVTAYLSATASQNFFNNTITGLSSTGAASVLGVSITGGTLQNTYKNKISNMQSNNAGGTCFGISISGSTTGMVNNIYNNRIGDLRAIATSSTSDAVRGISISGAATTGTFNVSYNTIYLNATSTGANFNTSGIFATTSTTATTSTLNLRNNIIVNTSTPAGTGTAVAYRRSSTTLTNYGSASNNNLLYGTAIFADGTNTDATMAAYQTRVSTRDNVSVSENPSFLSTTASSSDFLKLNPATPSMAESGAINLAGITDDFDGDVRQGNPGYAGSNIAPDMGADEFSGTTTNPYFCNGTPNAGTIGANPSLATYCTGATVVLTATGAAAGNGVSYQWQQSATSGSGFVNVTGGSGGNTISYTTPALAAGTVYYRLMVTCGASGQTAISSEKSIQVNPVPTATAGSNSPVCDGSTLNLTGSSDIGTTFAWTGPNSFSSSNQNPSIVDVTSAAAGTYSFTASAGGCTSTASTTVVAINARPTAVTAIASPTVPCVGSDINLSTTGGVVSGYSMNPAGTALFNDISATGTNVPGTLSDDGEHNITIPAFSYNGTTYTTARVGMNGAIVFGATTGDITFTNAAIPSSSNSPAGNAFLAPFWDDLDIQTSPTIKTQTVGDIFIIQYTNATHNDFTTGGITFQVQLELLTGKIHFIYQDVVFGSASFDYGLSATVGLNYSATEGLQYSTGTASLSNGQCITFTPNVANFTWSGPNGFSAATSSATVTGVTAASAGTYVAVATGSNGCTRSADVNVAYTITKLPKKPAKPTVDIARGICPGETRVYTTAATDTITTGFYWTVPTGATITAGQGTASVTIDFDVNYVTGGIIGVTAMNACGSSPVTTYTTKIGAAPKVSAVSGPTVAGCSMTGVAYMVTGTSVPATGYTWAWDAVGGTHATVASGQGTDAITADFTFGFASGILSVSAENGCGLGSAKTVKVKNGPAPVAPTPVTGAIVGVCSQSGIPYEVPQVGSNTYTWVFDSTANATGATIASGQGTHHITANFGSGFASGTLLVSTTDACATSKQTKYKIKAKIENPAVPSGPTVVCKFTTHTYSVPAVFGATGYIWQGPTGSTISDGVNSAPGYPTGLATNSTSVEVTFGNKKGKVTVNAVSACGNGKNSVTVDTSCGPLKPAIVVNETSELTVDLAPNPATEQVTVRINASNEGTATVRVLSITGQVMISQNITSIQHSQLTLPLNNLAAGLYMVEVIADGQKVTKQLMKQ